MSLQDLEKTRFRCRGNHVALWTLSFLFFLIALFPSPCIAQMSISFGQVISTSIELAGESDAYIFQAKANDVILVRMATMGAPEPYVELYNPSGSCLTTTYNYLDGSTTLLLSDPLPSDGLYTVLAADYRGGETGNYDICIQRVNNPGNATSIYFGQTMAGSIDSPGDMGTYTFDAIAGDVILVRMATMGAPEPYVELYNPSGSCLTTTYNYLDGSTTLLLSDPLPSDGLYTVLAADYRGGETGNYDICIQRVNNPGNATSIYFGQTMAGSIDSPADMDTFSFDAIAGDVAVIKMTAQGVLAPHLKLYSPNGSLLKENWSSVAGRTVEIRSDPISEPGVYSILTADYPGGETGTYTVSLSLIGNPGALILTPAEGFNPTGMVGGPFTPASIIYTLKNNANEPMQWSLSKNETWLDVSSTEGTLEGQASTNIMVSLDSAANALTPNTYADALTFMNVTQGGRSILRKVNLIVKPIKGILEVTPTDNFSSSGPQGGPFEPASATFTLKNVGSEGLEWRASETAIWLSMDTDNEHGVLQPGETADVTVSINEMANPFALGVYKDAIAFKNLTNGYGDTIREVTLAIGVSPSSITCEVSKNSLVLGEPLRVSGQITPRPSQAGAFVDVALIYSGGTEVHRTALANALGQFAYDVACGDLVLSGTWTVRSSWEGDLGYEGATSPEQQVEVAKAESRVSVNAASQAIKFEEAVDISGKFTPQPDCGGDLSGISLELHFSGPGDRTDVQNVMIIDRYGHYVLQDYARFNALGDWTIQAKFPGNEAYLACSSPLIQVRVVETAGYAIIVQGKIASDEGLASHRKTIKSVYKLLKARSLLDEDIKYLAYDPSQAGYDGIPSGASVQQAITEWARDKMNAKPANLYLIMVDHGFDDVFFVHPDIIISAELEGWLKTLQGSLTGQAAEQEIIIILGFCRSGSFVDELSGPHRVIITSAAGSESSYKGPLDADSIREGEYFVSEFFKSVAYGKSVKECFEFACSMTKRFTSSRKKKISPPYHDDSYQHPLLDDNGDGEGSHDLSDLTGDGLLSSSLFIGVSTLTGNDPEDVTVTQVAPSTFLSESETSADLWAKLSSNDRMDTLWIEIKAPGTTPINTGGSGQAEMNLPKSVYQTYNPSMDRYEWTGQGGFTEPGTYQVLYFAKDVTTENVSPLVESMLYKAKEGNMPPDPFSLVSPDDGAEVLTTVVLDWEDTLDPDGDLLTYTVLISRGDPGFADSLRKGSLTYSTCLIGPQDGVEDLSTYYWKVLAIDQYGAIRESDVRVFNTNNTNPVAAWIKGIVYNAKTNEAITNAVVSVAGMNLNTALGGYYLAQVPPGNYVVSAKAGGFKAQSHSGIAISDGQVATKDFAMQPAGVAGDIDGDGILDVKDLVAALKIVSKVNPADEANVDADVNGDSKIGMAEVIYILQKVGGLR